MIHILFVPGSFGSTIQYILRQIEENPSSPQFDIDMILEDGSMHSFWKTGHYNYIKDLTDFLDNKIDQDITISSPLYPMVDASAETIIGLFLKRRPTDKYIFIYIDDIDQAEIILLANHYKVPSNIRLDGLCGYSQNNINNWNPDYTHWTQMHPWELREWISMFYSEILQDWIDARQHVDKTWLTVSSREILENTQDTFLKIIAYLGKSDLKFENNFYEFINHWRQKQQYIIDEHSVIKDIVRFTILNTPYSWKKISIISEAMIQKKLRDEGYEIKCSNLNEFPTNSSDLHKLLKRI